MIVLLHHFDRLFPSQIAISDIFAGVVRGSAITELHKLHVVVNPVLVHIIEVGHGSVSPFERLSGKLEAEFPMHLFRMFVGIPPKEIADVNSTNPSGLNLLIFRKLQPVQIRRLEPFGLFTHVPPRIAS